MKRLQDKLESEDLFNKKSKQITVMDEIINTPGLQHIIEIRAYLRGASAGCLKKKFRPIFLWGR